MGVSDPYGQKNTLDKHADYKQAPRPGTVQGGLTPSAPLLLPLQGFTYFLDIPTDWMISGILSFTFFLLSGMWEYALYVFRHGSETRKVGQRLYPPVPALKFGSDEGGCPGFV